MDVRKYISCWIRSVIDHVYRSATDADCKSVKGNAREVWKISTSLLFKRNCAVQQVLKTGTWSSQMTSAFCLQGVTHRYIDTFSIGLVVAAQEVL